VALLRDALRSGVAYWAGFVDGSRNAAEACASTRSPKDFMNHRSRTSLRFALPLLAAFGGLAFACAPGGSESHDATHGALGQVAPVLGTAQSFAVLGGSTVTNSGATTITGNLGVNPGLAVTGFPPGIVIGGTVHAGDALALQAQTDVTAAYGVLASEACNVDLSGKDLGGLTLTPGVYCFSSSAQLTGSLVLDAGGRADAVFVFQMVSTLTTASNASVHVINGGGECGVFWQVGSSATLGTGTAFVGSILALTSISLTTGATVSGRALARNGAVTMDHNAVSVGSCGGAVAIDAGALDAAHMDAATSDGSVADAAPGIDASDASDASTTEPDASTAEPDASPSDAGTPAVDASPTPPTP
jgi:type VI secretion system secreted protein VgrG